MRGVAVDDLQGKHKSGMEERVIGNRVFTVYL